MTLPSDTKASHGFLSLLPRTASKPIYIHATALMFGGAGILIRGPSRSGKSSLTLALLNEAAQTSLYGQLIGDDQISVEPCDGYLILRGHPAISGKIEKRGEGILDVSWVASGRASYVIELAAQAAPVQDLIITTTQIEAVTLPLFLLPWAPTLAERAKLVMNLVQRVKAHRHQRGNTRFSGAVKARQ
jgi:serine kinase of HPr protein (carbohydrate metabolism regulator)